MILRITGCVCPHLDVVSYDMISPQLLIVIVDYASTLDGVRSTVFIMV